MAGSFVHTVEKGDTLAGIIHTYTGLDPHKSEALAISQAAKLGLPVYNLDGWAKKFGATSEQVCNSIRSAARKFSGHCTDIKFIELQPGQVVRGDYNPDNDSLGLSITPSLLPGGTILQEGPLTHQNGRYFVPAGSSVTISGIKIYGGERDLSKTYDVRIFFDGREHLSERNYVSFDVRRKQFIMGARNRYEPTRVTLLRGNAFVPMENKDDVDLEINGHDAPATFLLENRDSQGEIPKISLKGKAGDGTINSGWLQIGIGLLEGHPVASVGIGRGGKAGDSLPYEATGVPFEIIAANADGTPQQMLAEPLGERSQLSTTGHRLIVNNYDQVGMLPLDGTTGFNSIPGFSPFQISTRLADNTKEYTVEDFSRLFPQIKLTGEYNSSRIKAVIGFLQSLSPKMFQAIKGVEILRRSDKRLGAAAAFASPDGVIHMNPMDLTMPLFQHESSHILTFHLLANSPAFEVRWSEAAGNVYGKYVSPQTESILDGGWNDTEGLNLNKSRHGCIRSYGCYNMQEDIATYVEAVWSNPTKFYPLLDKRSPTYDARYQRKMDLLLEFGYITRRQYELCTENGFPEIFSK